MKRYERYKQTKVEFLNEIPEHRVEKRMRFIGYLYGGLSGKSANDFNILDAIYQTGITFTTVGFGEIASISQAGRLFTITLIIFGFAIFVILIGIFIYKRYCFKLDIFYQIVPICAGPKILELAAAASVLKSSSKLST